MRIPKPKIPITIVSGLLIACLALYSGCFAQKQKKKQSNKDMQNKIIKLPEPREKSGVSIEEAIKRRRSIRDYSDDSLSLLEISQLLWAAQGVTKRFDTSLATKLDDDWKGGFRTAPSAGGLYPIELYIAAGKVKDLSPGIYKYYPQQHGIIKILAGDKRSEIANAALNQSFVSKGAANIIIVGVNRRTTAKYGNRGKRYVHIESGAVGQNIYLQCGALGLGTVFVGAFRDDLLKSTLDLPEDENPLGIMPIGRKK